VKGKSLARLRSQLRNRLRPGVDLPTLAGELTNFLDKLLGKSARNLNTSNVVAGYLTRKYSIIHRKSGELDRLIAFHAEDLKDFLGAASIKDLQWILRTGGELPQLKKKARAKPQTETQRAQLLKNAKNRYESLRRRYRRGLIEKQFGTAPPLSALNPLLSSRPTGPCLDILFSGGTVRMCGDMDSLENLLGVDRHRLPKSLPRKRSGRNVVYELDALIECMIRRLGDRDGGQKWLPEPRQRDLVVSGVVERARRYSPELAGMLAEKFRPYLP
jgi:hypothetical protein